MNAAFFDTNIVFYAAARDGSSKWEASRALLQARRVVVSTQVLMETYASLLKKLKLFKGQSKLKRAAMNMMVKMSDSGAINKLRTEFEKFDKDKNGTIDADELKQAFSSSSLSMSSRRCSALSWGCTGGACSAM